MSAYAATGLQSLHEMLWGSHVCQFFSNGSDLRDTLVPFFKAGLQKNERCLLVAMGRSARAPKANRHDVRAWYNSVPKLGTGGHVRRKCKQFRRHPVPLWPHQPPSKE
jgi:hypothetical protein